MSLTPKLLQQGAAGSAKANYIEDVFSTYLYTGNGGTQTITNGIDLSTKGGLVWFKSRGQAANHRINDTSAATAIYKLAPNTTAALASETAGLTSFNTNGFTIGADGTINTSSDPVVSWTFRKQPKFFDVVTYSGNNAAQTIPHNLGSTPGCVIIKCTNTAGTSWWVRHRSVSSNAGLLNSTSGFGYNINDVPTVSSTALSFASGGASTNVSGETYVAYLFAHDAGGFGLTGTDNVISCGSYTGTGAAGNAITLGYEPQWLMIKRTDASNEWHMQDVMRGSPVSGTVPSGGSAILYANQVSAEFGSGSNPEAFPTATGFTLQQNTTSVNASGGTYIYIAIRRGPMKVPTTGTSVFKPVVYTGNGGTQSITSDFPVDLAMTDNRTKTVAAATDVKDRMRGYKRHLGANYDYVEQDDSGGYGFVFFDRSTNVGMDAGLRTNDNGVSYVTRLFRRAPGFFDVVCFSNAGGASLAVNHNLGVVPEMIIFKDRTTVDIWRVGTNFTSTTWKPTFLNLDWPSNNNGADLTYGSTRQYTAQPTATQFFVGPYYTSPYVTYLFATCPGVSKVGSYTGNGSTQTIDCGFSSGARFVLIKRTDSTGDWYTFDTARGIIAGNDPFLKFNTTTAEVSSYDAVDPVNSGFIVNNDATNYPINVASATYIFLAIA